MAFTAETKPVSTDQQLGAFSGYVRRPTPSTSGMVAQIFGENGDDADTILALSLSKYQDAQVFVNIYLVKDANGQLMKQGENYPLICSFLGFVRRSTPRKDGMVAQFFAPNGENSDAVADLSKSTYQDCLVFVDVRGSLATAKNEEIQSDNTQEIDKHYSGRLTKVEKEDITKRDKKYKKLNEELELDFLGRIEVLSSLGKPQEFKDWLTAHHNCAYASQEAPCLAVSTVVEINGLLAPFNFLPACDQHSGAMITQQHFDDNHFLYEVRHTYYLKRWAMHMLRNKFTDVGYTEPNPARIIEWAKTKSVAKYLPNKYQAVL